MFGQKKKRGLYYLLPGMNQSNRIRQRKILKWAILAGLIFAALFGLLVYWMNSTHVRY
jgi:high-affinity Fe2+/Pb2+ permease